MIRSTGFVVLAVIISVGCAPRDIQSSRLPAAVSSVDLEQADKLGDALLSRMTIEEKIELLSGRGPMEVPGNDRLKIPPFTMTDGPVGVAWGKATAFPASVALAASWDPALVHSIGQAIGREAAQRGRDVLLGPCVNLHRLPTGGRNFESYGEDPFLAGAVAAAFVRGVQDRDVIACVKHYAANNQEWNRMKLDVRMDERTLRELYLPAFREAVINGGARCVMSAYNKVNGEFCSENRHLLTEILKDEWGFDGFVVSDWGGVQSTVESALAGNDLEMPKAKFWGDRLLESVRRGEVAESVINDKLRRTLRARIRTGLIDSRASVVEVPGPIQAHRDLAMEAASDGMVLLKNDPSMLPLDINSISSIAIIGPGARTARVGGGGSSEVDSFEAVSAWDGMISVAGSRIKIAYSPGAAPSGDLIPIETRYLSTPDGSPGLRGEYFADIAMQGQPEMTRTDETVNFNWGYGAPLKEHYDRFAVRWTGTLKPPRSGTYRFHSVFDDGLLLRIGETTLIDRRGVVEARDNMQTADATIELEAGRAYPIIVEYFDSISLAQVQLGWDIPGQDSVAEAAELARNSDVAIVFAGLSRNLESEDRDRERMDMPGQDELIEAVVAANPRTIVVLQTGSAVTMGNWFKKVSAIIQAWFPGQEGGLAIARVLFGMDEPGGRLPMTFYARAEDCPGFAGYRSPDLVAPYGEGIFMGYRHLDRAGIDPLFPFGHGLSYTTFRYDRLDIAASGKDRWTISITLTNSGNRTGTEVVQLYVSDEFSRLPRPPKELKAFEKVTLDPGKSRTITMELGRQAFSYFDPDANGWVLEPGNFGIHAGSSSKDIRLNGEIEIR